MKIVRTLQSKAFVGKNKKEKFDSIDSDICDFPNFRSFTKNETRVFLLGNLLGISEVENLLSYSDCKIISDHVLNANGSFSIIIEKKDRLIAITDAAGSIPLYYGYGPGGFAVGNPVHEVAKATGLTTADEVSMIDFLCNHVVCYPYTWYQNVFMAAPGSCTTFYPDGKIEVETYWQPREQTDVYDSNVNIDFWAAKLKTEVKNAIERSLVDVKKLRVLFSGGEDSRAVLGLVPKGLEIIPSTVLERKNREYHLAKQAARLMGYNLDWIVRPPNYYRSELIEKAEMVGPGMDLRNTHMFGSLTKQLVDGDAILGGYSADTLFKTNFLGNVLQSKRTKKESISFPDSKYIHSLRYFEERGLLFRDDLVKEVKKRRLLHHNTIKKYRPLTAGNWHSLWPISNRNSYPHYLACLRIGTKVIEPFVDNKVYQLASVMPDICRINRKVFNKAFAKEMGLAGWYPTSGGRIPAANNLWINYLYRLYKKYRKKIIEFEYEKGYGSSWSADEGGWYPVNPADHFDEATCQFLNQNLAKVLKDGNPEKFWNNPINKRGLNALKVRALTLAFDVEKIGSQNK
ncbi:MAG: hypothetical protein ACOCYO_10315 [Bacteroidota bacterium]